MMAFRLGVGSPAPLPGYAFDFNINAICDIKLLCAFFACLPLCAYQSDTNDSVLYGDVKYVILFVKVKIGLNCSSNLKL